MFTFQRIPARANSGLTLIELLVVIAVTALLAGLLIPFARNAIEKSRASKCMGNLRSLGHGFFLVVQENNGKIPRSYEHFPQWHDSSGTSTPVLEHVVRAMGQNPNSPSMANLACPCAKWPGYLKNPKRYSAIALGYGVNPALMPWINPPPIGNARIQNIRRPSEVIVLGDAGQQDSGASPFFLVWAGEYDLMRRMDVLQRAGVGSLPTAATAETPVEASYFALSWMPEPLLPVSRHNNKGHFLFADGHVGALGIGEIREKNIFWNY